MDKYIKVAVISVFVMLFGAASALAIPVALSDSSLQDYFDSQNWSVDAANDQLPMPAGWILPLTTVQASMTFWREDFSDGVAFGIYSLAGRELAEVFGSNDTPRAAAAVSFYTNVPGYPGQISVVTQTQDTGNPLILTDVEVYDFTGRTFGFYIAMGTFGSYTKILFSDPTLNSDETALLLYKPSEGQYVFAGDIDGSGNFSDIVTQAESIAPVPEPVTMLLLGIGLVGIGAVGRKKLTKNS